jgi:hypothetical protein
MNNLESVLIIHPSALSLSFSPPLSIGQPNKNNAKPPLNVIFAVLVLIF